MGYGEVTFVMPMKMKEGQGVIPEPVAPYKNVYYFGYSLYEGITIISFYPKLNKEGALTFPLEGLAQCILRDVEAMRGNHTAPRADRTVKKGGEEGAEEGMLFGEFKRVRMQKHQQQHQQQEEEEEEEERGRQFRLDEAINNREGRIYRTQPSPPRPQ
ncbi:hypothetical protein BDZ91DRAFT_796036 [Kalaharituber pfeilii]|nr:hypothetical protein BDZ91DRAFT_796036 [Kalaharituber pfeilii]